MLSDLEPVAVLVLNKVDVVNAFPNNERSKVAESLTQEELNDIAAIVFNNLLNADDYFWVMFHNAVHEAASEVIDLDELSTEEE